MIDVKGVFQFIGVLTVYLIKVNYYYIYIIALMKSFIDTDQRKHVNQINS